jgi:aspartate/methionine/tyrosine aminotransferase
VSCLEPQGSFYAFPNIQGTGKASEELANLILKGGVAVLPGSAFGKYGEGYLRIVFANSYENIEKALGRMEKVIRGL